METNWRYYEEQLFSCPKSTGINVISDHEEHQRTQNSFNYALDCVTASGISNYLPDSTQSEPVASYVETDGDQATHSPTVAVSPAASYMDLSYYRNGFQKLNDSESWDILRSTELILVNHGDHTVEPQVVPDSNMMESGTKTLNSRLSVLSPGALLVQSDLKTNDAPVFTKDCMNACAYPDNSTRCNNLPANQNTPTIHSEHVGLHTDELIQKRHSISARQLGSITDVPLPAQLDFDNTNICEYQNSPVALDKWPKAGIHTDDMPGVLGATHHLHYRGLKGPASSIRSQVDQVLMSRRWRSPLFHRHSGRVFRVEHPGVSQHWLSPDHRGDIHALGRERNMFHVNHVHCDLNDAHCTRHVHQHVSRNNCLACDRENQPQLDQCAKRILRSAALSKHLNGAVSTTHKQKRFINADFTGANGSPSTSARPSSHPFSDCSGDRWLQPASQSDVTMSYIQQTSPSALPTQPTNGEVDANRTKLYAVPAGISQMLNFPSPYQWFPERSPRYNCYITIVQQPEEQHRARYQTEGSRGAVKDRDGSGFPIIQLTGWTGQASLQVFVATESGRPRPHPLYQAYLVAGKSTKCCIQAIMDGVNLIQMPFPEENNRTLSVECVGILKLRMSDVDQRNKTNAISKTNGTATSRKLLSSTDTTQASSSALLVKTTSRKTGKARLVFRAILLHEETGTFDVVQTVSDPILCTQLLGDPEISRISLHTCGVSGGNELFILGKNLGRDCRVFFRQLAAESILSPSLKAEDSGTEQPQASRSDQPVTIWHQEAVLEAEFSHQTHLVCRIPTYQGPCLPLVQPVEVQVVVRCDQRWSNAVPFTYQPEFHCYPAAPPAPSNTDSASQLRSPFRLSSPLTSETQPRSSGIVSNVSCDRSSDGSSTSPSLPPLLPTADHRFFPPLQCTVENVEPADQSVLNGAPTLDTTSVLKREPLCPETNSNISSSDSTCPILVLSISSNIMPRKTRSEVHKRGFLVCLQVFGNVAPFRTMHSQPRSCELLIAAQEISLRLPFLQQYLSSESLSSMHTP
ncbi:unnamed protein product [Dicrocoelium dendriticum]|nr:unnamed protein product [Dicrocoelium dendriticum]